MSTWGVVVPSNRPERLEAFEKEWAPLFHEHGVSVFVVRDEPPWEGIPDFIPRRSDMIRSWGFYQSWCAGTTFTLSLDDDVSPAGDLFRAYEDVFLAGAPASSYLSLGALTGTGLEMRGFPYSGRGAHVVVQWGGWHGVPDLDGVTQVQNPDARSRFASIVLPVPLGVPLTGCAMNFAFRTAYAPLMWQLPLVEEKFNRFGDIWGALLTKKTLDALGLVAVVNGEAAVQHERASDPYVNLVREAPGMGPNEDLWDALSGSSYREVTESAARYFAEFDRHYADHFSRARDEWLSLFARPGAGPARLRAGSTRKRRAFSTTSAAGPGLRSAVGRVDPR